MKTVSQCFYVHFSLCSQLRRATSKPAAPLPRREKQVGRHKLQCNNDGGNSERPGLGRGNLESDHVPVLHGTLAHLDPTLLLKVLGHKGVVKGAERSWVEPVIDGNVGTLALPSTLGGDASSLIGIPGLLLHLGAGLDPSRSCRERSRDGLETLLHLDHSKALGGASRDKVVGLHGAIDGGTLDVLADSVARFVSGSRTGGVDAGDPLHVVWASSHTGRLVSSLHVGAVLVDGGNPNTHADGSCKGHSAGLAESVLLPTCKIATRHHLLPGRGLASLAASCHLSDKLTPLHWDRAVGLFTQRLTKRSSKQKTKRVA